jgi:carbon storage regulator CsrA
MESVVIGERDWVEFLVKITVLEIKGGTVRLGIDADPDLAVHRLEIWEKIRAGGTEGPTGYQPRR